MKAKIKKAAVLALSCVMGAGLLTGCSSARSAEKEAEYRQKGINELSQGNYEEAVEDFQNALDQSTGGIGKMEIDICLYKAKALYLSGDKDGTYEVYTALIDYNGYADAYYLRGDMYLADGETDKALADYREALAKDPDNYDMYIGVYESLQKYGLQDQVADEMQKALENRGESAEDYMHRGRIYLLTGDYESAVASLQKAIDKDNVQANLYMAQVYEAQGDTDMADQYFQTYVDSGEVDTESLLTMGENLMLSGNYEQALKVFTAAMDAGGVTNQQQLMRDTIIAYEYNGQFDDARTLMQQYLDAYPDDYEAEDEMTFLETR